MMLVRTWRSVAGLVAGALVVAAMAGPARGAQGDVTLLPPSCGPNGQQELPSMSADGRFVALECRVGRGGAPEVFERDLAAGTTTLVSRASGPDGDAANGPSMFPTVSADGRLVAFASKATNLTPDDADGGSDVFVRDLATGATTLVSRASGLDGAKGDRASRYGSISSDGHFVAFESAARNLAPDDRDRSADVYVRDLASGTTTLGSRANGPAGAKANRSARAPSISGDGRLVAFTSEASNLTRADRDHNTDVFVRDLSSSTTALVSRASGAHGAKGHGEWGNALYGPAISADGRFVAFTSQAGNFSPRDYYHTADVFLRDLVADTTTLVTRATGARGARADADSAVDSISADGRRVAFNSDSENLVRDARFGINTYVRDLVIHTTALVNRAAGASGAAGNSDSGGGSLSGDGQLIAFGSFAGNLTPDDTRGGGVFVRDLGAET